MFSRIKSVFWFVSSNWKAVVIVFALLLVIGYLVIQPLAGFYSVQNGVAHGLIDQVEVLRSGATMFYAGTINDTGLCTRDPRMVELIYVLQSADVEVDVRYNGFNQGDLDQAFCNPEEKLEIIPVRALSIQLSKKALYTLTWWQWDALEPYRDLIDLPERQPQ